MRRRRARITPVMRSLWIAQGKRCGVCGIPMVPASSTHPLWGWTIEHVWPRARFNFHDEGNRFVSHDACNHAKGDRRPTGCEQIILAVVNAVLGHELTQRITSYSDAAGPSPLAAAFQRAGIAA